MAVRTCCGKENESTILEEIQNSQAGKKCQAQIQTKMDKDKETKNKEEIQKEESQTKKTPKAKTKKKTKASTKEEEKKTQEGTPAKKTKEKKATPLPNTFPISPPMEESDPKKRKTWVPLQTTR